jgi:hypothetical protein
MAKYGRPIADPSEELSISNEPPKSSGDPLLRRWWRGLQLALFPVCCFQFMVWVIDLFNAEDWSNPILRGVAAASAMIFVFVIIPIATYEMTYMFAIRPWCKQHIKLLKLKGESMSRKQTSD